MRKKKSLPNMEKIVIIELVFFSLLFFLVGCFRQMNESKLRKGTKYVVLKDEDVHTVTGALKQFFRELKTDLIPIEIVRRLPDDLGNHFLGVLF